MNATLKAVCGLLKDDDPDVRQSAAIVLARIHPRDPGVSRVLGETLVATDEEDVAYAILEALEHLPHENSVRYLLDAIGNEVIDRDAVLASIAGMGPKAAPALRKIYPKASIMTQCAIAEVLPRIRTEPSFSLLMETFQSEEIEVVRSGLHALREQMPNFERKEVSALLTKLLNAFKDSAATSRTSSLSALVIALGITEEVKAKKKLLEYVKPSVDETIRHHALQSLSSLDYSGAAHEDVFKALLPVLEEDDWEQIVRWAVETLSNLKPRRSQGAAIEGLLENKHPGVRLYAIRALGHLDSISHASLVLRFLDHPDHKMREAAAESLTRMPSAIEVILRELHEEKDFNSARHMVGVLEHHNGGVKADRAKDMAKTMCELFEKDDERYLLYRHALYHLNRDVFHETVESKAKAAQKKKDWNRVRDYLKLFESTEYMTDEVRFRLAVAKLKTSSKELSRTARNTDYCLELIAELLAENHKDFVRNFLSEKALDYEDYYYVGFHFSERLHEERRFGADVLRHITKKTPRSKIGKAAKEKLKVEGH